MHTVPLAPLDNAAPPLAYGSVILPVTLDQLRGMMETAIASALEEHSRQRAATADLVRMPELQTRLQSVARNGASKPTQTRVRAILTALGIREKVPGVWDWSEIKTALDNQPKTAARK